MNSRGFTKDYSGQRCLLKFDYKNFHCVLFVTIKFLKRRLLRVRFDKRNELGNLMKRLPMIDKFSSLFWALIKLANDFAWRSVGRNRSKINILSQTFVIEPHNSLISLISYISVANFLNPLEAPGKLRIELIELWLSRENLIS